MVALRRLIDVAIVAAQCVDGTIHAMHSRYCTPITMLVVSGFHWAAMGGLVVIIVVRLLGV